MTEESAPDRQTPAGDQHDEAAAWLLRLRDHAGDEEMRAAFETWREQSTINARAAAEVERAWGLMEEVAAAPEIVTARRDALSRARRAALSRWRAPTLARSLIVAASLLVAVVAVSLLIRESGVAPAGGDGARRYETERGETRVLTLADNSKISLDAKTAIEIRYGNEARLVELRKGQAYFDVAKDPARPFKVIAGGKAVVALGTAFNVELVQDEVFVTLVEGRVAITDAAGDAGPPRELSPGERLVATSSGAATIEPQTDIARTTAWRRGKLIFEDEPLSRAVERMNRYSRIALVAGDEEAAALGVSGVFDAGDADAFVEALEDYFGAVISRRDDGTIVIRAPA